MAIGQNDPSNLDVRIFRQINNAQSSFKSSLLGVTDYSVLPIAVAVPAVMTAYGFAESQDDLFQSGVLTGASEVVSYSVRYVLKVGIKRRRPYDALSNVHASHLDSADPYSFPSGHSTAAFALATMLTFRYPRPEVYVPVFLWAGLVGYGRVYFGLHYPSDVIAGALIGMGSSILVYEYRGEILSLAYKVIGREPPANISAFILPSQNGGVLNFSIRF
ncbi:MAG TPA: phosphatase PAP2 family protein [Bacteroidota bacterium]|nr:phosphatase PAP2 family protein [Bacteroidota bacterium]